MPRPIARFTWACNATTAFVTFNGSSSSYATSYSWNLDVKTATGPKPTADYSASPGDHYVSLTVKGPGGTSDPKVQLVHCP